jgi:hypothetical protein
MYMLVHTYGDKGGAAGNLVPALEKKVVPLLRRAPGFEAFCVLKSLDDRVVAIALFADEKTAARANNSVRDEVISLLRSLVPQPPETLAGEILHFAASGPEAGWKNMHVAIHVYDEMGLPETAALILKHHVAPAVAGLPGFLRCYAFIDERNDSRGVLVSMYDMAERAERASEEVLVAAGKQQIALNSPATIFGTLVAVVPDAELGSLPRPEAEPPVESDANRALLLAERTLLLTSDLYWEIRRGIRQVNEEAEIELGRWVNILSYVVDNSDPFTNSDAPPSPEKSKSPKLRLSPIQIRDLLNRATLAIDAILRKPNGSLNLAREMRHEILLDIYRAENRFSEMLLNVTSGSPSFTVVLGVAAASLIFAPLLALIHGVEFMNVFSRMDQYFGDGLTKGSIEAAAIAAFAGGLVSVLTRLEQFEARRGIDPKLLFFNAAFRPYIGTIMAMFVVAVQGLGIISIVEAKPNKPEFAFFLIVVGFLSGFSERFATDFIGSVEGGFATRRVGNRPTGGA